MAIHNGKCEACDEAVATQLTKDGNRLCRSCARALGKASIPLDQVRFKVEYVDSQSMSAYLVAPEGTGRQALLEQFDAGNLRGVRHEYHNEYELTALLFYPERECAREGCVQRTGPSDDSPTPDEYCSLQCYIDSGAVQLCSAGSHLFPSGHEAIHFADGTTVCMRCETKAKPARSTGEGSFVLERRGKLISILERAKFEPSIGRIQRAINEAIELLGGDPRLTLEQLEQRYENGCPICGARCEPGTVCVRTPECWRAIGVEPENPPEPPGTVFEGVTVSPAYGQPPTDDDVARAIHLRGDPREYPHKEKPE